MFRFKKCEGTFNDILKKKNILDSSASFRKVQIQHIRDWFKAKKPSLNNEKTKYTLHKNSIKYDLPLKFPDLKIANNQVQRKKAMKFTCWMKM